MARGFYARKALTSGHVSQRTYELRNGFLVLLQNQRIRIPISADADPIAAIKDYEDKNWKQAGIHTIEEFDCYSGTYIPSVARPRKLESRELFNPVATTENEMAKSYNREHDSIAADIERCFNVVSPSIDNFQVYGTEFEKILYFACVGVESLFNKILSDNSISIKFPNMNDFIRLKPLMRLEEYSLKFVRYPWLPPLSPFQRWTVDQPSQSLEWFDAYNSLKHSKRANAKRATLYNALNGAAGYYLLSYAVFGGQLFDGFLSDRFFFWFSATPQWKAAEIYFGGENDDTWVPRVVSI